MYTSTGDDSKTAFVLSGGGSRGAYEIGVWQALLELGIRIDIVTGTSVGALNGAIVTQGNIETAVNLWSRLETEMVFDIKKDTQILPKFDLPFNLGGMSLDTLSAYAREMLRNGGAEYTSLKTLLSENLNEDAIRDSVIDYGIVTVELETLQPHFLYKSDIPQGKLLDYMLASAACFPALKTYEIDNVKYIDGGYSDNLPIGMALDKGATHVIAVDLEAIGVVHRKKIMEADYVKIIQSSWDLGNFLVFEPKNSKRIMRLGYLDAMKSFDVFDGNAYSFIKGQMDRRSLNTAESAGKIFELDPGLIYSKTSFNEKLKEACDTYTLQMQDRIKSVLNDISRRKVVNLPNLLKRISDKTVTAIILQKQLQGDKNHPFFAGKAAATLFKQETEAANYIIRTGLYRTPGDYLR